MMAVAARERWSKLLNYKIANTQFSKKPDRMWTKMFSKTIFELFFTFDLISAKLLKSSS